MTWKQYAAVSGAGVIATYLASTPVPRTDAPAETAARAQRREVVSDIAEQAVRLQSRVRAQTAYRPPERNPFRFSVRRGERPSAQAAMEAAAPAAVYVAPVPPPVPVTLVGIAEEPGTGEGTAEGTVERMAILKTAQGIVFVRKGDAVGEYTVRAIDAGSVELAATDGSSRRIVATP